MLSHPLSTTVGYCSWTLWGAMYTSLEIVQPSAWDKKVIWSERCSVVSDSLPLSGLYSPWNSPGQNTGVCSLSLLQGIFPTQGLNPGLPHFTIGGFFTGWATREAQEHSCGGTRVIPHRWPVEWIPAQMSFIWSSHNLFFSEFPIMKISVEFTG